MTIQAIEFGTPSEAVQYTDAAGGVAISVAGKVLVTTKAEADRLEASGKYFAYIHDHDCRLIAVPVNG